MYLALLLSLSIMCCGGGCPGRQVLSNSSGVITDGPGDYSEKSLCEWLINATSPRRFIRLEFVAMDTECFYDYVFVYDGPTFSSPQLASLSGNTSVRPLIAKSGYMLVYFFSDHNYQRSGFEALYYIEDCPYNCNRAECQKGRCSCDQTTSGQGCETSLCSQCKGDCDDSRGCICPPGYLGYDCTLSWQKGNQVKDKWINVKLENQTFTPRAAHAGVIVNNNFFIFGGRTLGNILNDFQRFDLVTGQWVNLTMVGPPWPSARYGHSVVAVDQSLYLYGGTLENGLISSELWQWSLAESRWYLLSDDGPAVTEHSMVVVNQSLYLIGGRTLLGDILCQVSVFNFELTRWQQVDTGCPALARLVGHSATYDPISHLIYVFGGYTPDSARFPLRSNLLFALDLDTGQWVELKSTDSALLNHAFHSASIIGRYLVVYGGTCHLPQMEIYCHDNRLFLYHLDCHKWLLNLTKSQKVNTLDWQPPGRSYHVADVAHGNTLIVIGGYRGHLLGDVVALTFPDFIAQHQDYQGDVCKEKKESCISDPSCLLCGDVCMNRTNAKACDTRPVVDRGVCPGVCAAFNSCLSCTALGRGVCAWCVKEAQCQDVQDPKGTCLRPDMSGTAGWWGGLSALVSQVEQCVTADIPAGLTLVEYWPTANLSKPDLVRVLRSSYFHITFGQQPLLASTNNYSVRLFGFVHPLGADFAPAPNLILDTQELASQLYLSTDQDPTRKQLLLSTPYKSHSTDPLRRPLNASLLPLTSRGHKYFVEYWASQTIKADIFSRSVGYARLEWNAGLNGTNLGVKTITFEFLEPFSSGECSIHDNCLPCLADAACVWCSGLCRTRMDGCQVVSTVIDPWLCPQCRRHTSCQQCTQESECAWHDKNIVCARRGQNSPEITEPSSCPTACHELTDCDSCITVPQCAWCDSVCFPFIEYMLRFSMGSCPHWVDDKSRCHSCALHTTCAACFADFRCGWCGDSYNPTIGVCIQGDFIGPKSSGNCPVQVPGRMAFWSYDTCPDVEECILGMHNCHENATCENTLTSYECHCRRGFEGDGRKDCRQTCYEKCVHGVCSGPPMFECHCTLGWTGVDCSEDCGCFNHSTCSAPGDCDQCQDYTRGQHCELCIPGSYGNATTLYGCRACDCNGHGDPDLGYCDRNSGLCFCRDNTEGKNCHECKEGYYGNPRNGGHCYMSCSGHVFIYNATNGALGTYTALTPGCVTFISTHADLEPRQGHTLTISILPDTRVTCFEEFVYVYDGVASHVAEEKSTAPLAAVCGYDRQSAVTVQARSGVATIIFQASRANVAEHHGFNATYRAELCEVGCLATQLCQDEICVCRHGYAGASCQQEICPGNCTAEAGQGECTQIGCRCFSGFLGPDCSLGVQPRAVVVETFPSSSVDLDRTGHAFVECAGALYLHGGYSVERGPLGDLWRYDLDIGVWDELKAEGVSPPARYLHAMACVPTLHALYLFGGIVDRATRDLYRYHLDHHRWTKLEINDSLSDLEVPAMAGHTMTLIGEVDTKLWIVGGMAEMTYFTDHMFEYDASDNLWYSLLSSGIPSTGVHSHSTVYNRDNDSLFVFGGMEFVRENVEQSSRLYRVDVDHEFWSLPYSNAADKLPGSRYGHAAGDLEDFMLVIGGFLDNRHQRSLMAYRYNCSVWLDLTDYA